MTTKNDIEEIGRRIALSRNRVPYQNRQKYEIEAADHFAAIQEALQAGDEARAAAILADWEVREFWLINSARCHVAPPCLIRRPDETEEHFNERRLAAWRKY
jgi:hypothetical protein